MLSIPTLFLISGILRPTTVTTWLEDYCYNKKQALKWKKTLWSLKEKPKTFYNNFIFGNHQFWYYKTMVLKWGLKCNKFILKLITSSLRILHFNNFIKHTYNIEVFKRICLNLSFKAFYDKWINIQINKIINLTCYNRDKNIRHTSQSF